MLCIFDIVQLGLSSRRQEVDIIKLLRDHKLLETFLEDNEIDLLALNNEDLIKQLNVDVSRTTRSLLTITIMTTRILVLQWQKSESILTGRILIPCVRLLLWWVENIALRIVNGDQDLCETLNFIASLVFIMIKGDLRVIFDVIGKSGSEELISDTVQIVKGNNPCIDISGHKSAIPSLIIHIDDEDLWNWAFSYIPTVLEDFLQAANSRELIDRLLLYLDSKGMITEHTLLLSVNYESFIPALIYAANKYGGDIDWSLLLGQKHVRDIVNDQV